MSDTTRRRTASVTALLAVALAALPARAEVAGGVEVALLENGAGLGESEVGFLDNVVLSNFALLPVERFPVERAAEPAAEEGPADEAAFVDAARERGAAWLVTGAITPFGDGYLISLKLIETTNGQLEASANTGPQGSLEELLAATERIAAELRDNLMPLPRAAVAPAPPPEPEPEPEPAQPAKSSVTATLRVTSTPPGARVYVGREDEGRGSFEGTTPLDKELLPLRYRVSVTLAEHFPQTREIRLDPADDKTMKFVLQRDYPANPYKIAGHLFFWPGLIIVGLGFPAMANARAEAENFENTLDQGDLDSARRLTGLMWAAFGVGGALVTAGVVSWIKSPGDKAWYEQQQEQQTARASLVPTDGGLAMTFTRRF